MWTTEKPTKPGWYWWRSYDGFIPVAIEIAYRGKEIFVPLKAGEWQPVQPPIE